MIPSLRPAALLGLGGLAVVAMALPAEGHPAPAGGPRQATATAMATGTAVPAAGRVVALRGYAAVAPENTLAALRAAAGAGVRQAWLDLRTTADGALVLLADETLDRTTTCQGRVQDLPASTVLACDAGVRFDPAFAGERVPRLAEALAEPLDLAVLWLADADPAAVLAEVRAAGAVGRVVFATEQEPDVAALRAAEPAARVWLRLTALSGRAVELAGELGAAGLALDNPTLAADDVAAAQAAGLALAMVDVPDERTLAAVLHQGARYAVTARVEAAVRALGYAFRTYLPADLGRPERALQGFGRALAVGDVNGDRRPDLVFGAPLDDTAGESAGWTGIALGADRFPGPVQGQAGDEPDSQWGSLFAVADFNDDRHDDLAIGYPQRDFSGTDSGAVWLIDGSPAGIGGLSRPIGSTSPAGSHLGQALAVGDFNGDTVTDLAIGAPDRAVANVAGAGQVTVMPGLRGSGPVATGALVLDRLTDQMDPEVEVPGELVRGERLGAALAAGDFNGDLVSDLAVGVPGADAGELRGVGAVLVTFGAAAEMTGGPALAAVAELNRLSPAVPGEPERGSGFGTVLAAADFDKDGFDDLAIGVPDATVGGRRMAGELIVLYGGADGFVAGRSQAIDQDTPLIPGQATGRARFGAVLATGDLDGDGHADLAVGMPDDSVEGQPGVGAVTVVYGGPDGLRPRLSLQLAPEAGLTGFPAALRQAFGRSLAIADLNRDGAADLAVGVPGLAAAGLEQGAVVVAWGEDPERPGVDTPTPPPPTQTPEPTLTRTPRPTRSPTPTVSPTFGPTPTATPTARPPAPVYLPWSARLKRFDGR
jgi:glycerophosphoryl diester phosphodiesterase